MRVDILLSTYNGEKYLKQQIESIISQTYQDWRIVARDDGSSDCSLDILRGYAERLGIERFVLLGDSRNVGVVQSFSVLADASDAPFVMFCDQDDYWLPTKVKTSIDALTAEVDWQRKPVVVHTDLKVVDADLKVISDSFVRYSGLDVSSERRVLAVRNCVTGCAMMVNSQALRLSLPFPAEARMHDAWVTLSVSKAGGVVRFVPVATMLYRQHGSNVLGAVRQSSSWVMDKLLSLRKVVVDNRKQWAMLKRLDYCSLAEYVWWKFSCR